MTHRQNSVESINGLIDSPTPFGTQLRGVYKRSPGYRALNNRLPIILTKVIDVLSRSKEAILKNYGESSSEDLKRVIGRISKLKSELVTNKPLVPLVYSTHQNETNSDIETWNEYLAERTKVEGRVPNWYSTLEFYAESYMYRRIMEAFYLTDTLYTYDPFVTLKQASLHESIASIVALAEYTLDLVDKAKEISEEERKQEFSKLLRVGLWGNRFDLSLHAGTMSGQAGDPLDMLDTLEKYILVDDTETVWNFLAKARSTLESITIDIVLDNAGYELFSDLCLAALLTSHNYADKIRLYVKSVPWFISDVTRVDLRWVIETMIENSSPELSELGKLLKDYLASGLWTIEDEPWWTGPFLFKDMKKTDPKLYAKLSEATLIIFKGDLNYRKLAGDVNWEYGTDLREALQGFFPANFVSLRSIKTDTVAGLKPQVGETLDEKDPTWRFSGKYGLVQACIKELI